MAKAEHLAYAAIGLMHQVSTGQLGKEVIPSQTGRMKTAISVPDETYDIELASD